jgi:hypothetical protein
MYCKRTKIGLLLIWYYISMFYGKSQGLCVGRYRGITRTPEDRISGCPGITTSLTYLTTFFNINNRIRIPTTVIVPTYPQIPVLEVIPNNASYIIPARSISIRNANCHTPNKMRGRATNQYPLIIEKNNAIERIILIRRPYFILFFYFSRHCFCARRVVC